MNQQNPSDTLAELFRPLPGIKEILENQPLHLATECNSNQVLRMPNGNIWLKVPSIVQYCPTDQCDKPLNFDPTGLSMIGGESVLSVRQSTTETIIFRCRHCRTYTRTFALNIRIDADTCTVTKFGETPPNVPPPPRRLLKILSEQDKENYRRGRSCEAAGLGIGAYAYYRRMVEDCKDVLIDELIRALDTADASDALIPVLKAAKAQRQFKTAIESFEDRLPKTLWLGDVNPIKELHTRLSDVMHNEDDKTALRKAVHIRTILFLMIERITEYVRGIEEAHLAVARMRDE